jgi:hypothetical protein
VLVDVEANAVPTPQGFIEQVELPRDRRVPGYRPRSSGFTSTKQPDLKFRALLTTKEPAEEHASPRRLRASSPPRGNITDLESSAGQDVRKGDSESILSLMA